jgi:5-methylcytosine-specific restriction protein A
MTAWRGSTRKSRLPGDWQTRRTRVAHRANGLCQVQGCGSLGAECDHTVPNDDHALTNLQWLCKRHHMLKTQGEALAARPMRRRPSERHPGLL